MLSPTYKSKDDRMVIGQLERKSQVNNSERLHSIFLGQELLLGRDVDLCQVHFFDPTVSNKHLKIYSVVYDQSSDAEIKPLVYAEDLSRYGSYWNGSLIGEGQGAVLLSDGDEIRISPRITLVFRSHIPNDVYETDDVQETETNYFLREYRITSRKLGSGAHGCVNMAVKESTGGQLACKIVDLRKVRAEERRKFHKLNEIRSKDNDGPKTPQALAKVLSDTQSLKVEEHTNKLAREVELLKELSHPNIIRLEKVYQSYDTLYIFEELITGGDLFSYLQYRGGHLEETLAGAITYQITAALKYLHERDVVHRDLKPENILVANLGNVVRVVLTDFGNAIKIASKGLDRMQRMQTNAGTRDYVAPEVHGSNLSVHEKGYTKAVDMWSLGCVTTAMLTGSSPFSFAWRRQGDRRSSTEIITEAASLCQLDDLQQAPEWKQIGHRPRDFILKLLVLDEEARMKAKEAIDHDWFTNNAVKEDFQAVYKKSTAGWRRQILPPEAVEYISGFKPSQSQQVVAVSRRVRCPGKAIEPHYQPSHRRLRQILAPRSQGSVLTPEIAAKEWEKLMVDATCHQETGTSRAHALPALEKLHISQVATQDCVSPTRKSVNLGSQNPSEVSFRGWRPGSNALGSPFSPRPTTRRLVPISSKDCLRPVTSKESVCRRDIFDIAEDEEGESETQMLNDVEQCSDQTNTNIMTNNTSPTTINQRQSMKLGSAILGKRSTNLVHNENPGHNGPLLSKKLKASGTPHHLKYGRHSTLDESPSQRAVMRRRSLHGKLITRRELGVVPADKEQQGDLASNTRQHDSDVPGVPIPSVSPDLTDSIRTA